MVAAVLACAQGRSLAENSWVTTWGCAPQLTEAANLPPEPLADHTLRQFVRTTVGGKILRVRFSNIFGTNPVTIHSAHLALAAGRAGSGEIDPATDQTLTFGGASQTVIPRGETVLSDPLAMALPPLADVAVSVCFGEIFATSLTGHPGSRTTSFIVASNAVSSASLPSAKKTAHWYLLAGIEVAADHSKKNSIVVLGDSITDGRGSTTDGHNRWPDNLAARLQANLSTTNVGVVNMGIGGNAIFGGLGPAAVKRFDRDVLGQSGVRWLIVFEGVNDIGGARAEKIPALATNLIAAYQQFAAKAHTQNLRVYGATITPFGGNGYYSAAHEMVRQEVNAWLRTNSVFDGVIDFDAAVRQPVTLTNLLSAYDTGDHLHLNPAGYQALAAAVDLNLFSP